MTVEDRRPAQAQAQLGGVGEVQAVGGFELLDVDVRLIEAVEKNHAGCAERVELFGEMAGRREERRQFHRDRDGDGVPDLCQDVDRALFHRDSGFVGIGGDVIDVELERVRAGLFDQVGVVNPAAHAHAVERADHRDVHRLLDAGDLVQVAVRPEAVVLHFREIGDGLGERFRRVLGVGEFRDLVVGDLLLKKRVHDDGGGPGVFEAAHVVELVNERRGSGHHRVFQGQAEVGGGEVHVDQALGVVVSGCLEAAIC